MRFSAFTTTAFAGSAFAFPSFGSLFSRQGQECLTREEATEIVDVYQRLIANYQPEDGEKYCASDFVDRSDSINTFIFQPLGEPTFATKEIFMEAVSQTRRGVAESSSLSHLHRNVACTAVLDGHS